MEIWPEQAELENGRKQIPEQDEDLGQKTEQAEQQVLDLKSQIEKNEKVAAAKIPAEKHKRRRKARERS